MKSIQILLLFTAILISPAKSEEFIICNDNSYKLLQPVLRCADTKKVVNVTSARASFADQYEFPECDTVAKHRVNITNYFYTLCSFKSSCAITEDFIKSYKLFEVETYALLVPNTFNKMPYNLEIQYRCDDNCTITTTAVATATTPTPTLTGTSASLSSSNSANLAISSSSTRESATISSSSIETTTNSAQSSEGGFSQSTTTEAATPSYQKNQGGLDNTVIIILIVLGVVLAFSLIGIILFLYYKKRRGAVFEKQFINDSSTLDSNSNTRGTITFNPNISRYSESLSNYSDSDIQHPQTSRSAADRTLAPNVNNGAKFMNMRGIDVAAQPNDTYDIYSYVAPNRVRTADTNIPIEFETNEYWRRKQ